MPHASMSLPLRLPEPPSMAPRGRSVTRQEPWPPPAPVWRQCQPLSLSDSQYELAEFWSDLRAELTKAG
ncbi:hypothetical protein GUJ93_ZPchr0007g3038 [Zizania palustris]|uniref:Uncharacterized protein n=1 Tax=Zizania palustris TaxID=103762 RepID=A0A8J5TA58_ZIZPA|nr:hypothetical protein GUJ93_ZPchr0007g3038 [Zizania palustris]